MIPLATLTSASNPKNTKSEGKNVSSNSSTDSEIDRLADEVKARRVTAEAWDTWNIRLVFLAGLAATLLVVTAVGVSRSNRNLISSSDQLDRAKDRKLQDDLKSKDDEIAKLDETAAGLKADNLQLEAAIAPRRLSDRQKGELSSLSSFLGRTIELKSYANDTEGLVLASQIIDALSKSPVHIQDNRLTMQGGRSVTFGVAVEGADKPLIDALKRIFSANGNLIGATVNTAVNIGFSVQISTGVINSGPVAATITVGVKPIK